MKTRWPSIAVMAVTALKLAEAEARTFHVSPNGDDGNSGAQDSPFRTIQKAAGVARAGDVVLVQTGVYQGQVFLRYSGEPGKPIVFKSAPGEKPVVDGEGKGRIELQSEQGWQRPMGWVDGSGSTRRKAPSPGAGTSSRPAECKSSKRPSKGRPSFICGQGASEDRLLENPADNVIAPREEPGE